MSNRRCCSSHVQLPAVIVTGAVRPSGQHARALHAGAAAARRPQGCLCLPYAHLDLVHDGLNGVAEGGHILIQATFRNHEDAVHAAHIAILAAGGAVGRCCLASILNEGLQVTVDLQVQGGDVLVGAGVQAPTATDNLPKLRCGACQLKMQQWCTHLDLGQLEALVQFVFACGGGRGAGLRACLLQGRRAGTHGCRWAAGCHCNL